jgi:predicted GNAT family N-acyltransferase
MEKNSLSVGLVCKRPTHRDCLVALRQWCSTLKLCRRFPIQVTVESFNSVESALNRRTGQSDKWVLVTAGFTKSEIPELASYGTSTEPVILMDRGAGTNGAFPSCSFEHLPLLVECNEAIPHLRKSLLRLILRQWITIRTPTSDEELTKYFTLRYLVWNESGFLKASNRGSQKKWELDHSDRTALPLVAVTNDGQTIGCVRLVRNYGREDNAYVRAIKRLLDGAGDRVLQGLFEFPHSPMHPFDILEEFPGFRCQYRELMKQEIELGEISRVVVDPEYRGNCIAEALVDTAITLATRQRVRCLFLACHDALSAMYQRSGFQAVEGLRSPRFFNIEQPSIVMRRLI